MLTKVQRNRTHVHYGLKSKVIKPLRKKFGDAPKLNVELPYDPDIPFLDIASKKLRARSHQHPLFPDKR